MADIFDEVSEELRAERGRAVALRYGGAFAALAVVVVLCVAGWQAWRWYDARQTSTIAVAYFEAMRLADAPEGQKDAHTRAITAFEQVAQRAHGSYRTLARLRAAALKADAGDRAGALALWNAVAADADAPPMLRDLATLLAVRRQVDDGDPAALAARLKPLEAPENKWHALAAETQALLDLRAGNKDAARAALQRLTADPDTPEGLRDRAGTLLESLSG